ncbi:helix-turn-helix transcriptional regulator [Amnibacterium endophyticum]|uniref:Helix-turn-helix transcriptional regulator n=1 Tax=Amnibacterium endophyticum TaxID=2109337 RepID=A0ABW4LI24_9MICO
MADPSARLLLLLSLLQVQRDWPGDLLADRLEVSLRTVRRDVDRLRGLGYRVEALRGPAGGYRLASGSALPPLLLDDDQAVAVALALAVAPASGADIAEAAVRALGTVRQVMPSRLRERVDAVEVSATPGGALADPAVLVAVSDAARRREVLRFEYGGRARPRRVEPHAVVARHGRWYLLAWDGEAADGAGDWRSFRVDRIAPRAPTRLAFTPRQVPGGDAVSFLAARFKGSAEEDAWPCVGTAVVGLAARRIAPFVDEHAEIEALDAERARVTLGSWSWPALAARFAGFGAVLQIEGPEALRDAAVDVAARLREAADRR